MGCTMSELTLLLEALNKRKEQKKDGQDIIHEWSKKVSPVMDGTDSAYQISKSALKFEATPIPVSGQVALSSTTFVLGLLTTIPSMIAIATSKDKSLWEKLVGILPLFLTTLFNVTATLLGLLFLLQVGTLVLATAGSAVGLVGAAIYLGFVGYNLYNAYAAVKVAAQALKEGPRTDDALLKQKERLEMQLKELLKPSSSTGNATYSNDDLDIIQANLDQLHNLEQMLYDQSEKGLQRKDHIAKENLLAALVNVGLSMTGILLATIGLMILVATTIAAPPLVGIILAGIGLALSAFGLIKLGTELKFSWDETANVEKLRNNNETSFLDAALKALQPEVQVTLEPAIDLENDTKPQIVPNTVVESVAEPHVESEEKAQTLFTSKVRVSFYNQKLEKHEEEESVEPTPSVGQHRQ